MKIESTHFLDKKMPKADSNYTYLAVMLIDFVIKKDRNYYPQVFFKDCKYTKKKIVIRDIADDLEFFFLMILLNNKLKLRIMIESFFKKVNLCVKKVYSMEKYNASSLKWGSY